VAFSSPPAVSQAPERKSPPSKSVLLPSRIAARRIGPVVFDAILNFLFGRRIDGNGIEMLAPLECSFVKAG
jgi:hypothetical protein